MKRIVLLLVGALLMTASVAGAQAPPDNGPEARAAMKKLAFLVGNWQGDALLTMGPQPSEANQVETVESRLDGAVLLVEGRGTSKVDPNMVVHHALAVISYDVAKKTYDVNAYLSTGHHVIATGKVHADGSFEWGFSSGGRTMRYIIRLANDMWVETGEYSMDGSTWNKFIEMQLKKKA